MPPLSKRRQECPSINAHRDILYVLCSSSRIIYSSSKLVVEVGIQTLDMKITSCVAKIKCSFVQDFW
jgi:hypothetical protein